MRACRGRARLAALLVALAATGCGAARPEEVRNPSPAPLPAQFFGMHVHHYPSKTPWPAVRFGSWRLNDRFALWSSLEPERGRWDFRALDSVVEAAAARGVEIVLVLGHPPQWASARPNEKSAWGPGQAAEPRDSADWENFVRTVATRYRGRIRHYEVWNEPNWDTFFSGRVDQMVALARAAHRILKEIDPSIVVVSPSATYESGVEWLDRYLAQGGGAYADAIGFHFYVIPGTPEDMVGRVRAVREVMARHGAAAKPLWNTEFGWLFANRATHFRPEEAGFPKYARILAGDEAGAYVARSLVLGAASGMARFHWYAWDDGALGLVEPPAFAELKVPARAYERVSGWLAGRRIESCARRGAIWTCAGSGPGDERFRIVWSTDAGPAALDLAQDWGVRRVEALDGGVREVAGPTRIEVTGAPVLLR